ncbi:MAG TPA: tripartite tricarboxylate transporter TctB family protein [Syntrophorhabdaceae bacterium]|nr:tripartite tricarboxylate transporter TctB family protein [Syntrophorhabdaceae bacterium]
MKKYPLYITFVWIVMGIFVSAYSYRIGLGNLSGPGPGFMPFWLGIIFVGLGVYKLTAQLRIRRESKSVITEKKVKAGYSAIGKITLVVVILFIYALLLEHLGYILVTFITMALLLRFAGYTRWIPVIVYALLIAGSSYFIFHYLGVLFPVGIFNNFGLV